MRIKKERKISVLEVRGGIEESSTDPYCYILRHAGITASLIHTSL
jgi:hypothetical protein